jgi:hypothetical protein
MSSLSFASLIRHGSGRYGILYVHPKLNVVMHNACTVYTVTGGLVVCGNRASVRSGGGAVELAPVPAAHGHQEMGRPAAEPARQASRASRPGSTTPHPAPI